MSLIKNSFYNIIGIAIPTLFAIPMLGLLSRLLGIEAFGLFVLFFAIIGYASIFDIGITRTVIREVSINRNNKTEIYNIMSTSSITILFLSSIASALLFMNSEYIAQILNVSAQIKHTTIYSLKLLSLIFPIFLYNQLWLAYLEGLEEFKKINIQKIGSGIFISVIPVIFCWFNSNPTLFHAVLGLIIGRILSLIITVWSCKNDIIMSGLSFYPDILKRIISFGSWLTISNIISPIMVYFDRFILSNLIGAKQVVLYAAPAEGIMRSGNLPFALARVLFTKLSFCKNKQEELNLIKNSYILMFLICLPIILIGISFASPLMKLWMGKAYGGVDASVLQILLIGFGLNSIALIPFTWLQAKGKANVTAILHMVEVIPYVIILYYLTYRFGVIGTASAWSIRMLVDLILLCYISKYLYFEQ